MGAELVRRIAAGREIRSEAERMVATRGALAESVAWLAARMPDLAETDRMRREAVAIRVSWICGLAGGDVRH
jgi:hypothetical protein